MAGGTQPSVIDLRSAPESGSCRSGREAGCTQRPHCYLCARSRSVDAHALGPPQIVATSRSGLRTERRYGRQLAAQQNVAPGKIRRLAWSLGPEFSGAPLDVGGSANGSLPPDFPRGRIILSVGRWDAQEAYKGVDHLILALPRLLEIVADVHLVAVGSGTDMPRLQRLAQESLVENRIHFLSSLSQEQLTRAYQACDVLPCPAAEKGSAWSSSKRCLTASRCRQHLRRHAGHHRGRRDRLSGPAWRPRATGRTRESSPDR